MTMPPLEVFREPDGEPDDGVRVPRRERLRVRRQGAERNASSPRRATRRREAVVGEEPPTPAAAPRDVADRAADARVVAVSVDRDLHFRPEEDAVARREALEDVEVLDQRGGVRDEVMRRVPREGARGVGGGGGRDAVERARGASLDAARDVLAEVRLLDVVRDRLRAPAEAVRGAASDEGGAARGGRSRHRSGEGEKRRDQARRGEAARPRSYGGAEARIAIGGERARERTPRGRRPGRRAGGSGGAPATRRERRGVPENAARNTRSTADHH